MFSTQVFLLPFARITTIISTPFFIQTIVLINLSAKSGILQKKLQLTSLRVVTMLSVVRIVR
jgi:preprotein translocase subunit SecG